MGGQDSQGVLSFRRVFEGRHETGVDDKGRVGLIAKFREHFGESVTVLKWENHLMVMTPQNFEKLVGFVGERLSFDSAQGVKNFFNPKVQKDRRHFFGNKFDLSFDAQGRLTLPKTLRESADLLSDVVWTGCGEYLELWAKKHWDADVLKWEQEGGFERLFEEPAAPAETTGDEPAA